MHAALSIKSSSKGGRGVFTSKAIKKDTAIETSPVLVFNAKERKLLEGTLLARYIFEWGNIRRKVCVALGYVSLYNHDYDANCRYEMDFENDTMTIITVRDIKKDEEITVNYNAVPDDKTPVWFKTK